MVLVYLIDCLHSWAITYPWLKFVTCGISVIMLISQEFSLIVSVFRILFVCSFTNGAHGGNI